MTYGKTEHEDAIIFAPKPEVLRSPSVTAAVFRDISKQDTDYFCILSNSFSTNK
jgi:hypothetical protein